MQIPMKEKKGFTLVEMLISLTLFAMIIIMAFDAMGSIGVLRTRVSSRLDLNNELYSASEKFVDIIKTGGDIDYEEYWNRTAVGMTTSSGHYDVFSGFGNYGSGWIMSSTYGDGLYYCVSSGTTIIGSGGCLGGSTQMQRYGQYRQQFIDYNANANNDLGDQDGNGNIRWDDDDEDLWIGPSAFTGGTGMKELYLIKKGSQIERTYLRWILTPDTNSPTGGSGCVLTGTYTWSDNCLGNIQVLKLVGRDLGLSHNGSSPGQYDGIIDTWECHGDYNCATPSGIDSDWVNIFPEWVNVKSVDFYPYPEKDFRYAWKESGDSIVLNSYVRIKMTLGLAWERRKKIKWSPSDTTITTTVNLSK